MLKVEQIHIYDYEFLDREFTETGCLQLLEILEIS